MPTSPGFAEAGDRVGMRPRIGALISDDPMARMLLRMAGSARR
jgi:hypothetical protein